MLCRSTAHPRLRVRTIAVGMIAAAAVVVTGTAIAEPGSGQGLGSLPFTCVSGPLSGQTVIVNVAPGEPSAAGFIDGQVYLLESITVTVAGGGVVDQHTYGQRNGAGAPSECIATLGAVTIDTVIAPAGQAGT
jgi:hypothetical protein